ncbi:MAG: phosphotransferase [Caldilineaceae bacterium]
MAPLIDLPSPRCYYSDYDKMSGSCVLLLEDLSQMRAVDRIDGCHKEDAELVIRSLAKFHAQWWDSPRLRDMGYLTPFDHMASYSQERFQEWWPTFLEKLEPILPKTILPESFRKLGRQYGPLLAETMSKLNQPPITIIHRDLNTDNLMFGVKEDDPPLTFFDWQLVGYGRGVSDVTYFMVYAVPTDVRRQEEYNLLRMYHSLLEEYGIRGYDFEHCWFDYKLAFFRNLSVAVNVIALSDTSHPYLNTTVKALLPRLIAFSEDHEVSGLLQ